MTKIGLTFCNYHSDLCNKHNITAGQVTYIISLDADTLCLWTDTVVSDREYIHVFIISIVKNAILFTMCMDVYQKHGY